MKTKKINSLVFSLLLILSIITGCSAEKNKMPAQDKIIEDFSGGSGGWEFISDDVMGGLSTGRMQMSRDADEASLKMTGRVSLENNGGFIQVRRKIAEKGRYFDASGFAGVRIRVKGDGHDYAVHLRSRATWLPWQYYEAKFKTTGQWQTVELAFEKFEPYFLKSRLNTAKLKTIAIVAIKEAFEPEIEIKEISFYVDRMYNKLTPEEERIIIGKGTERPFSGKFYMHFEDGCYVCRRCGAKLFESGSKFKSECGWPSFDDSIPEAVKRKRDADGVRTEILCANCGGHLGHVFNGEGLTEKNTRYCVNSLSMDFEPVTGRAIFAAGCFWGVEHYFKKQDGVISTTVGYIGGNVENPTYKQVCYEDTGHAEALLVEYDPDKTGYEQLAKLFFEIHDFTQLNRQGPDIGEQYRSAVFYTDQTQKQTAQKLIDRLKSMGYDVKTSLEEAGEFYEAEDYHQDYYEKTGKQPYCHSRRIIFDQ
ncbi:Peptide methionine sulfoxide reductase MsrA [Limihaloglobus sulfuriphilus]|uniref:Peptide methionine sulfoxide reductase MsrA n=2 Tax=Limihaloglobus sulfuriphilus TaxID=1851148 RepID=A0A1Q2MFW2_9BACT|nr:Peptide methionine sulfoxide reductase MsrA [Limihaloglobus sulfuriphilus]